MVTQLSDEQRSALQQESYGPIYVDDLVKHVRYVLISADVYETLLALANADRFRISKTYLAQEQALGIGGWHDPVMDAYNDDNQYRAQP